MCPSQRMSQRTSSWLNRRRSPPQLMSTLRGTDRHSRGRRGPFSEHWGRGLRLCYEQQAVDPLRARTFGGRCWKCHRSGCLFFLRHPFPGWVTQTDMGCTQTSGGGSGAWQSSPVMKYTTSPIQAIPRVKPPRMLRMVLKAETARRANPAKPCNKDSSRHSSQAVYKQTLRLQVWATSTSFVDYWTLIRHA